MRHLLIAAALGLLAAPVSAQRDSVLASRWVGIHQGRPLQFEFYGDTMLVVGDAIPLTFRLTSDSLVADGDTTIRARWRYVLGHVLLDTPDGPITMSAQSLLARPLTGRWIGPLGTPDDRMVEMVLAANGTARWRDLAGGAWTSGEWERESRLIDFTWPDETEWQGQYDPIGNNLLLLRTLEGSQGSILRRAFR